MGSSSLFDGGEEGRVDAAKNGKVSVLRDVGVEEGGFDKWESNELVSFWLATLSVSSESYSSLVLSSSSPLDVSDASSVGKKRSTIEESDKALGERFGTVRFEFWLAEKKKKKFNLVFSLSISFSF